MIAATAVLVSHAFPITLGEGTGEPLFALTGQTLGGHAVVVFFMLSGLLIARSFDRGSSVPRFILARIARLFPALVVVVALTVLAGAFFTTLPLAQYFTDPETLGYVPRNLSLAFLQYPLPGVFEHNPLPDTINGSLWTLFYEVLCYAAVVAFGLAGLLRRPIVFSVIFALIAAAYVGGFNWEPAGGIAYPAKRMLVLGMPFALGMLAYVWRDRLVLDFRLAAGLWVLPVLSHGTILLPLTITVALGYTSACLGFLLRGKILYYNRLGDYSYGVYLYAFPVQQAMAYLFPRSTPMENILWAMPVALLLAVLSWHLVEERALRHARRAGERLFPPTAAPDQPLRTGHP
jgi:peptidoglycan/LPS O-acetylase OafA/YrhL